MSRLAAAALPLAAVLALSACGTPSPDLFVVNRTGSVPDARLRLRVTDGGDAFCNGSAHQLPSHQLILSRVLARDLSKPAKARLALARGPGSILQYRIRTQDGTVSFSDTSRGQPAVFYRAAELVRQIAKGPCALPR